MPMIKSLIGGKVELALEGLESVNSQSKAEILSDIIGCVEKI